MAGRRHRVLITAALMLVLGAHAGHEQQEKDLNHLRDIRKRDKIDVAIRKGIDYLVKNIDPKTGAFRSKDMPSTITALACMALMANGHFPNRGQHGDKLRKGILYLVQSCKRGKGYFGYEGNARMYGQGICTLALAEAYGMMATKEENQQVRRALESAVMFIVKAQTLGNSKYDGGWHYYPKNTTADLSVSAWQVLALRAAQNCGLAVPKKTLDKALKYVRSVYSKRDRAFTYNGGNSSFSMRSAGVVCMLVLGANKSSQDKQQIRSSASFLLGVNPSNGKYFYYQSYYIAIASSMMGGKYREAAGPRLEEALLRLQEPDGKFKKHTGEHGKNYSTAFAVICLSARYQYLPVYQE